ncbi:hypothetical protein Tco_1122961 [Tanacetum coccineum]|uniref:Uncharacterized protein n=1 Tax=Tanacetum coccineum TaxID=301880 RepID=A0ABQ5J334_9ASTR
MDADVGADEIASDGNVDPYYEARVNNTVGDVLERYLLPIVPGPYYISYPYDEGSGSETALDRFPTSAETHRLRELSSVENIEHLSKQCTEQTQNIKRQSADLKQQNESTIHANGEVFRLTAQLGVLKSRCQTAEQKLSSWDNKHRKFLKSGEFNRAFAGVLNMAISVGVKRGLRMDRTDEEFMELSQRVVGFIPDAKEKFDRVIAAFPDTTFPFLDKTSSATTSVRANTHVRHSTSSSGTFGHTSTPKHLKKKKKPVEKGGHSAV